jgi:hypothetical protein
MNSPVVDMQALWQKPEWKAQFEQIAALQSPWQKYLEGIQRESHCVRAAASGAEEGPLLSGL